MQDATGPEKQSKIFSIGTRTKTVEFESTTENHCFLLNTLSVMSEWMLTFKFVLAAELVRATTIPKSATQKQPLWQFPGMGTGQFRGKTL